MLQEILFKLDNYLNDPISFKKNQDHLSFKVSIPKRKNKEPLEVIPYSYNSEDKGNLNEFKIREYIKSLKDNNIIIDYVYDVFLKVSIPGSGKFNTLQLDFLLLTEYGLVILETKYRNTLIISDKHAQDSSFQLNRASFLFSRYYGTRIKNENPHYAGYVLLFNNFDLSTSNGIFIQNKVNKMSHLNICTMTDFRSKFSLLLSNLKMIRGEANQEMMDMDKKVFTYIKNKMIQIDMDNDDIRRTLEERHKSYNGNVLDYKDRTIIEKLNFIGRDRVRHIPGIFPILDIRTQKNLWGHRSPLLQK